MAILKRILRALSCCLLILCGRDVLVAASIGTQWEGLAHTVAGKLESYAKTHDGKLPSTIDELYSGVDAALLQDQLRGSLSSKIVYFSEQKPQLEQSGEELLAVIAFPISEDRRPDAGRYTIYRNQAGKIGSRWESEKPIQAAISKANLSLPFAETYQEKPIKPLYPEYGMRLVEDAVKHGVPIEQAVKAVEKHADEVSNRRAKPTTTWAEVATATTAADAPPTATAPSPATPVPSATPAASPQPATPVAQTPAAQVEQRGPLWPWVFGIFVLLVIVAFALKHRA